MSHREPHVDALVVVVGAQQRRKKWRALHPQPVVRRQVVKVKKSGKWQSLRPRWVPGLPLVLFTDRNGVQLSITMPASVLYDEDVQVVQALQGEEL